MLGLIAMLATTGLQDFECSIQGNKLLVPPIAAEDICARIAEHTAQARKQAGPLRIAIAFTRAGVASAQVTRTVGGKTEDLPDISIATSDRAMTMRTVEMLADEIARALTSR